MRASWTVSRWFRIVVCIAPVLAGEAVCVGSADAWQVAADNDELAVYAGARPVALYRYGGTPFKPYLQELYTPAGLNVLLDAPPDHLHHHGLMFALEVNGVDFWGETQEPACGVQRHIAPTTTRITHGPGAWVGCFAENVDWIAPGDSRPMMSEERVLRLEHADGQGVTLLTWSAKLRPAPGIGPLTIGGRHYFGLGMRFVRAMDRTGAFFNPDNLPGDVFRGDERLVRSRWCAYTGEIDGKPVTVAMFDSPANPRHPALWFTMKDPFAYLAATLGLHEQTMTLDDNSTLDMTYGVALWDGRIEAGRIENLYREWLALTQPGNEKATSKKK